MGYTGNFTRVTRVEDDRGTGDYSLLVEGTSHEADLVKEIYVAVPHNGELLSVRVENAVGAARWDATFSQGARFDLGEDVVVVGVAILTTPDSPFIWSETHRTTSRVDPPG
jgi:hypothetical protein